MERTRTRPPLVRPPARAEVTIQPVSTSRPEDFIPIGAPLEPGPDLEGEGKWTTLPVERGTELVTVEPVAYNPDQTRLAIPDPFDLRPDTWSEFATGAPHDRSPEGLFDAPRPAIHGPSRPLPHGNPALRYLVHPFGRAVVEPLATLAGSLWRNFDAVTDKADEVAIPFQLASPTDGMPPVLKELKNANNVKQIVETPVRALLDPLSVSRKEYGTPIVALGNTLAEKLGGLFGMGDAAQNSYDVMKLGLDGIVGRPTEEVVGQPIERAVGHLALAGELLNGGDDLPSVDRPEIVLDERPRPPPTRLALDPDQSFPIPTLPELNVSAPPRPVPIADIVAPTSPSSDGTMSALPAPPVRPPRVPDASTIAVPDAELAPLPLLPCLIDDDEPDPARRPAAGSEPTGDTPGGSRLAGAALGGGVVGGGMSLAHDLYRTLWLGEEVSLGEAAGNAAIGAGVGAASEMTEEIVGRAIAVAAGGADLLGGIAAGGLVEAGITGVTSTLENGAAVERGELASSQATANVLVDTSVALGSGLAGAATGAAIGSVVPIAGTTIGAGLGFAGGALASLGVSALAEHSGFSAWAKENVGDQLGALETPLDVAWGTVNGGIDGAMTGAQVGAAGGAAMGALSTGATAAALGMCVGGPLGAVLAGAAGAGIGAIGGGLIGAGLGVVPGAGLGAGMGLAEELVELAKPS